MTNDEHAVARFLRGLPRTNAEPLRVELDDVWYCGAHFTQRRDTPEGSRAYREGERTYIHRGYYLLGARPESHVREQHVTYIEPMGTRYYVAGWWTGAPDAQFHPFGAWFLLCPDELGHVTDGADERSMRVLADQSPRP